MSRKIRGANLNGNILFTSSRGVMEVDVPSLTYGEAGVPIGLDTVLSLVVPTTGAIFSNAASQLQYQSYAYRIVWGIRNSQNNVYKSSPSQRQIIYYDKVAVAANRNVSLTFTIPKQIKTSNFYQIYRTKKTSSSITFINPGDEMFLVYESSPTSAQIIAGTITIEDFRPDTIMGEGLYTNASNESIFQANNQPPYCRDLATFKSRVWFAYTKEKEYLDLSLIGVSGFTTGVSTITIDGISFKAIQTADTSVTSSPTGENIAAKEFVFYNTLFGTSPSEAIRGTAESLIRVINRSGNSFVAYYTSAEGDIPGSMYIERVSIGDTFFVLTSDSVSTGSNFEPKLPVSGTFVKSTNNERSNRIYYSKEGQPVHCPSVNFIDVGSMGEMILRILPLRDSLIVIKTKTAYRITGTSPSNFSATLIENTINFGNNYESFAVINNVVVGKSNQGFIKISDTGSEVIGYPINSREQIYGNIIAGTVDDELTSVFGIGYESQKLYICSVKEGPGEQIASFVFNVINGTWTRWMLYSNCYGVLKDRLYFGLRTYGVMKQRPSRSIGGDMNFSYDEEASINITAINTTNKTINITFNKTVEYSSYNTSVTGTDNEYFSEGWMITYNNKKYIVESFSGSTAKLNSVDGLVVTTNVPCFRPIVFDVMWNPIVLSPETYKTWGTNAIISGTFAEASKLYFYFYNENYKYQEMYNNLIYTDKFISTPVIKDLTSETATSSLDPTTNIKISYVNNFKRIRVNPGMPKSNQLTVRMRNFVAGSKIAIKSLSVELVDSGSEKSTR